MSATTTLYRPVGPKELTLARESRSRELPPRLEVAAELHTEKARAT
jgi:hypothetical protein